MGNCMFMYAAAIAHAARTGQFFTRTPHGMKTWECASDVLGDYGAGEIPALSNRWKEPSFAYTPIPTDMQDVILEGWFQSEKYFEDQAPLIKSIFPRPIEQPGFCGIHVRRGDYVNNPHFIKLDRDWYEHAMQASGFRRFLVFSDDPQYCADTLFPNDIRVSIVIQSKPILALKMLAGCEAVIMANSSFSWWAAWLAEHNHWAKIIAPSVLFSGPSSHIDTKDWLPARWEKI